MVFPNSQSCQWVKGYDECGLVLCLLQMVFMMGGYDQKTLHKCLKFAKNKDIIKN